ncbi:NtaA/DmoA family FMN-dependent monooxygenase [Paenarthrobacter sp. NPDC056912]|uniref:NtaA/DmoA family FMN-dependent monooxygenase n=1 Tax=Paenarthrobacter sp. NPDC056912 TaxID=3345965 RepID=UPI003672035D
MRINNDQTAPPAVDGRRALKLGAVLHGVGGAEDSELWRHPEISTTASVSIDWYVRQARQAEDAHFDFVFIVDSQYIDPGYPNHHLNRLEPTTLLAAVAVNTERIGLVATVSTTYSEPWDIARRLASLDLISDGRAAWNIVTSFDPGTAGNFSRDSHGDYATRYRRATESIDVVTGLWDSYEDDAFATDKSSQRFLDPSKLHRLEHVGEFFSVTGPLNVSRSRQGQPVLVQAGTSEQGRELSATKGEVIFSFAKTSDWALDFAADVRERAAAAGRNPQDLLFIPALGVTIRDTDDQARREADRRREDVPLERRLATLSRFFGGHDFTVYDPDQPFPDLAAAVVSSTTAEVITHAREAGLTLRETILLHQDTYAHFSGTAETVAAEIERWYRLGAADGFNLFVSDPEDFRRFRQDVVPSLVRRGIFRENYESDTLRGNLELAVPLNRHAKAVPAEPVRV